MTMNPFEQSTQQLLRFLTSHAEWEVCLLYTSDAADD